ncbi:MAG TPA: TonB-dependent receptor, partial [Chitinophagaceae bacterium]
GGGRGMGMISNFIGGNQPGIARTLAGGLNYNDAWSRNTAVSGSYFYNNMNILNGSDRYREFFLKNDSSLFTSSRNESRNKNQNHRFNFEIDQRLDSFNSILIRPAFSFQDNTSFSGSISRTTKGKTINRNAQDLSNYSDGNGYTFNNSVLFRHRFGRKGRTFSLNLTQSLNNNSSDRRSLNYNTFYAPVNFTDTSDYITAQERSGKTFGATASYTEPIGKRSQMELSYNYNNNRNNSDQDVVSYDQASGKYVQDDTLSNEFYNTSISHRVTASVRQQINKDWNWVAGIGIQHSELTSDNRSRKQYFTQSFDNFFPTVSIQYSKNRARNIRINYRGSTRQPAITQLQDVIDPTNTLSTRRGNAALDQEFVHSFNLMYASFDIFTFKNFFAGINGGFTSNKISNYVTTNSTTMPGLSDDGVPVAPGGQHTTYTNLDGAFNFATFMNIGFPVKKLKGNLNLTSTVALNRDVSMVRDISEASPSTAYTRNYVFAERVSFNMNIRERFDLNLSGTSTYSMVKNSRQPRLDADYFTQMISLEPTYSSKKGWIFALDFDYNFYRGQSEGYNQEIPLLNASIAKQLFKNKAGELKIQAFDLLNQNQSITRTVETNYVEDANTRVLQRYFMVSFTYHLRKFGQNTMPGFFNIFRGAPMPGTQVKVVN